MVYQLAFFQGYVGIHALKKQTCTLLNGCNLHVSEIFSGRRNDLHLLAETDIDTRLRTLTQNGPPELHFMLYGDSAYPILSRITHAIAGPGMRE